MTSTLKVDNIAHSGGTTGMTIDSSGNVTVPNNATLSGSVTMANTPTITSIPYFYAYGNGTQAWSGSSAYATLALSGVFENVGSHYNASTYKFTCPRDGVYFFWYSFTNSTNSSTGPQGYIVYSHDGSSSYRASAIQYNDYYTTVGNNAIFGCSAGGTVEVKLINVNDTSFTIDSTRCTFGGYLIG